MFNSKSYEVREKQEVLYQPKRVRCLKFIVIPALVCFILTMILVIVDFDGTAYSPRTTTTPPSTIENSITETTTMTSENILQPPKSTTESIIPEADSTAKSPMTMQTIIRPPSDATKIQTPLAEDQTISQNSFLNSTSTTITDSAKSTSVTVGITHTSSKEQTKSTALYITEGMTIPKINGSPLKTESDTLSANVPEPIPMQFATHLSVLDGRATEGCVQLNDCSIMCSNCKADKLKPILEQQFVKCKTKINVQLIDCEFPGASELNKKIFEGNYEIRNLIIDNCDLEHIQDGAFDQKSTAGIEELHFREIELVGLNERTFVGLKVLKYFELINENALIAYNGFLQPFGPMLQELRVAVQGSGSYDPGMWLGAVSYENLHTVDFSGNNFSNKIYQNSFHSLAHVESLNLSSCSIAFIPDGTFESIILTLQYLDLSNNKLTKLDGEFLSAIDVNSLRLELFGNPWNCSCANQALITQIQNVKMEFREEPKCSTPPELKDFTMKSLSLQCDNDETAGLYNPFYIYCHSHRSIFNQYIRNYDMRFYVRTATPSSVDIYIAHDMNKFQFIHFQQKDLHRVSRVEAVRQSTDTPSYLTVATNKQIFGLSWNQSYVFCLVPDHALSVSPFNCQSHNLYFEDVPESWLDDDDKAMFLILVIFGTISMLVIGGVIVYYALRARPTWLCGSKRVLRTDNKSKHVFLLPKENALAEYSILKNRQSNAKLQLSANHYMDYYRDFGLRRPSTLNHNERLVPTYVAPSIPKSYNKDLIDRPSTSSGNYSEFSLHHYRPSDNHDHYEQIDYYEAVF